MQPMESSIERRVNHGGRPRAFITGTRVRVLDIYALAELQRQTPDQIVDALPHLSLAQVHGALAYYFAHRDEIVSQLREDEDLAQRLRSLTELEQLEGKLRGKAARPDSIPS